jgi:hypothetical protein
MLPMCVCWSQAMEEEHVRSKDSGMVFVRTMNKKKATPMEEWEIVIAPIEGKEYTSKRTIGASNSAQPIDVFYAKMAEMNRELRDQEHAELIEVEVIGARLYTGARTAPVPAAAADAHSCADGRSLKCSQSDLNRSTRRACRSHVRKIQPRAPLSYRQVALPEG